MGAGLRCDMTEGRAMRVRSREYGQFWRRNRATTGMAELLCPRSRGNKRLMQYGEGRSSKIIFLGPEE